MLLQCRDPANPAAKFELILHIEGTPKRDQLTPEAADREAFNNDGSVRVRPGTSFGREGIFYDCLYDMTCTLEYK